MPYVPSIGFPYFGGLSVIGDSPPEGETCIITANLVDMGGVAGAGQKAYIIIESTPQTVDDAYIIAGVATALSDDDGVIEFPPIVRGAKVLIRINAIGYLRNRTVPDAANVDLVDMTA